VVTSQHFKENPKRTKIKLGPLILPEYMSVDGEMIFVGENDTHLHCFFSSTGQYHGVFKSEDENHMYQHLLKLNT